MKLRVKTSQDPSGYGFPLNEWIDAEVGCIYPDGSIYAYINVNEVPILVRWIDSNTGQMRNSPVIGAQWSYEITEILK